MCSLQFDKQTINGVEREVDHFDTMANLHTDTKSEGSCNVLATTSNTEQDVAERRELMSFIEGLHERYHTKAQQRMLNRTPERPAEENFFRYDSSVKKNTAFVKRLKQFTAQQLASLMQDASSLNLTKYISEVSAALVEAKLKMNDIAAIVELCSYLHQTYTDFAPTLFENWQKVLLIKPSEKVLNPSKMRVDLRFYAELISTGIFSNKMGLPLLGACLTGLIAQDKEEHINLSIILSFCKHCGDEYAGLVPIRMTELAEKHDMTIPTSQLLPADKQCNLRNMLNDYYHSLADHLKIEHTQLQSAEKSKWKMLQTKGEITAEKRDQLAQMQVSFEKLFTSTSTLADLLGQPMPELAIVPDGNSPIEGTVIDGKVGEEMQFTKLDPWRDEETKSFYIDLPDLRLLLPNYCGKKRQEVSFQPGEEYDVTECVDILSEPSFTEEFDLELPELETDAGELESTLALLEEGVVCDEREPLVEMVDVGGECNSVNVDCDSGNTLKPDGSSCSTPNNQANRKYYEQFVQNLQNCVNRELIDNAAIDFLLNLNNKSKRKRLVKVLFGVQRTRLDLLPMYARFVAIIDLVSPDVAHDLCQMLKIDFKYHLKKKDQINIETKIKVVRYIGELVKFGIYKKIEALYCLRCMLQSFQHHHIEMTCAFLEVCGVYLYNCSESRMRTNAFLEQMMRLKMNTTMDARHAQQVENCYYLVKRPEKLKVAQKARPIIHSYIRYLIYKELDKSNVDKVIKLLRRIDWSDPSIFAYAVRCLSKAYNIRYHLIRSLADLLAGLNSYQEQAVVRVIDTVFEDIRTGLEIHDNKLAQRRVAMVKYLGELYNYQLIDSYNLLNTLYSIISFGVNLIYDGPPSAVDPPESLFRLKLACVLLDTSGQYFTSGINRKRLDYFLVFFQQYYWYKKSHPYFASFEGIGKEHGGSVGSSSATKDLFPILMDHMYRECFKTLRPKMKLYTSFEQAKEAVQALRQLIYPGDKLEEQPIKDKFIQTTSDVIDSSDHEESIQSDMCTSDAGDDISENFEPKRSHANGIVAEDGDDDTTTPPTADCVDLDGPECYNFGEDDDDKEEEEEEDEEDQDYELEAVPQEMFTLPVQQPEDLEFEREFDRMTSECIQQHVKISSKINPKQVPVPASFRNEAKKSYDQLQRETTMLKSDMVPFALMIRGKGKQRVYKTFEAPEDSHLAQYIREQERKQQEEKDSVKRLTLNISERLEEEDYQESLNQPTRMVDPLRMRPLKQAKFKHPKGVPDIDAIFH